MLTSARGTGAGPGGGGGVRSPDPYLLRVGEAEDQTLVAGQSAHADCDSAWSGERTPPPTTGPARLALRIFVNSSWRPGQAVEPGGVAPQDLARDLERLVARHRAERDHLLQDDAEAPSPPARGYPEDVRDAIGIRREEKLARGSQREGLAQHRGNVRGEVGHGEAEVRVDVRMHGGEIALLPHVRIARVQEHEGHAAMALDVPAQVQGVGGEEIEIVVAEARVELHAQLLSLGDLQRAKNQVVIERLVGQAHAPVPSRALLGGREGRGRVAARRLRHAEPGAIRDDALEPDVAGRARAL